MKALTFSLFKKVTKTLSGTGLWNVPGVALLWKFIYKRSSPEGEVLIVCQGSKMYVNADLSSSDIGPILLTKGIYEENETELFKSLIKPGMVVLDVGANIGYYSLIAAGLVGDTGKVYAFEPEPKTYDILVRNIRINGFKNIYPIQIPVSDKSAKTRLYLDRNSSCLTSLSGDNVLESGGFLEVESTSLDDFLSKSEQVSRVDILKMDVQGAEGLVIAGAEDLLRANDLKIIMEFWPHGLRNLETDPMGLLNYLKSLGFKMEFMDGTEAEIPRIIEICKIHMDGRGYVNLLLRK